MLWSEGAVKSSEDGIVSPPWGSGGSLVRDSRCRCVCGRVAEENLMEAES